MKPTIPQGTRDFSADTVRKRQYLFETIRGVFELYGFAPLETPSMENLETLMGKYGEEGDKLMFKILNNGLENPLKHDQAREDLERALQGKSTPRLTERALRYDLTIPFARYVAMNHGQLPIPYKRYQIQPVWRADRPQKGRYREFYQCDADIAGSTSPLYDRECLQIYEAVFEKLGLAVEVHINNRKILGALADCCGGQENMVAITTAIDKLDKIGMERVKMELSERGISDGDIQFIEQFLSIGGNNAEKMEQLSALLGQSALAQQGIKELNFLLSCNIGGGLTEVVVDFTLARGLNYYTGAIFEVKAKGVQMGSIGGGGRYDNLTALFGLANMAGVGISFGVDRIYDVVEELKLFPKDVVKGARALFFNLGERECNRANELAQELRRQGIACEIYPEHSKFDKQFKYAEKKGIPFAIIIGTQEVENGVCVIKELASGRQVTVGQGEVFSLVRG